jgi:hypothetical protein
MLRRLTGALLGNARVGLFNRPIASFSKKDEPMDMKTRLKIQQVKKELEDKAEQEKEEQMIHLMNNPETKRRIVHFSLIVVLLAGTGTVMHVLKRMEGRRLKLQEEALELPVDPNKELKEVVLKYSK